MRAQRPLVCERRPWTICGLETFSRIVYGPFLVRRGQSLWEALMSRYSVTINLTRVVGAVSALLILLLAARAFQLTTTGIVTPTGREIPDPPDRTIVAIDSSGQFYINAIPVRGEDLTRLMDRVLADKQEKIVYLSADPDARYSAVMEAMDALRLSRMRHIALLRIR